VFAVGDLRRHVRRGIRADRPGQRSVNTNTLGRATDSTATEFTATGTGSGTWLAEIVTFK
jgi:hypothetical protein